MSKNIDNDFTEIISVQQFKHNSYYKQLGVFIPIVMKIKTYIKSVTVKENIFLSTSWV